MSSVGYLLADVQVEDVAAAWRSMNSSTLGSILLCCAMGLVALLAFVWAVFFRKSKRRRRSRHHSHRHSSAPVEPLETPAAEAATALPQEERKGGRFRRRRRARNPTLAETGGLPPVRPDGPAEPQS